MGRPTKYQSEEERKQAKAEAYKRWAEKNRETLLAKKREQSREWRIDPENRKKKNEANREYYQEHRREILDKQLAPENRERKRETERRYIARHLEEHRTRSRKYAREHVEENRERARQWNAEHPYGELTEEQKQARREQVQRYRERHPEKIQEYSQRYYDEKGRERYKLTRSGRRMPGGNCELCGREETALARRATGEKRALHRDHDHETGVLRGLLCLDCNRGLGAFKDNPALLRRAAEYIESYRTLPEDDYELAQGF